MTVAVLLGFFIQFAGASQISTVLKNNSALLDLESGRLSEANKTLSDAAVNSPRQAELFYNLGQTYENNEEKDKAVQSYLLSAQLAQDPELKFQSYFNAARVLGDQKQIEPAVELYQKALEIHPDSVEAKTNIELLFQGGGGGGGDKKQDKDKDGKGDQDKDQQDKGDDKDKNKPKPDQNQQQKEKPKPKPFQSQELSPQDAKKILDELRQQEEKVRAKFNEKRNKETPVEKDW